MFSLRSADADLSQEQELRGSVAKSFSSVLIFGRCSGEHCLGASLSLVFPVEILLAILTSSDVILHQESMDWEGHRAIAGSISLNVVLLVILIGKRPYKVATRLGCSLNLEPISLMRGNGYRKFILK